MKISKLNPYSKDRMDKVAIEKTQDLIKKELLLKPLETADKTETKAEKGPDTCLCKWEKGDSEYTRNWFYNKLTMRDGMTYKIMTFIRKCKKCSKLRIGLAEAKALSDPNAQTLNPKQAPLIP